MNTEVTLLERCRQEAEALGYEQIRLLALLRKGPSGVVGLCRKVDCSWDEALSLLSKELISVDASGPTIIATLTGHGLVVLIEAEKLLNKTGGA